MWDVNAPDRRHWSKMIRTVFLTHVLLSVCFFTCIAAGISQNRVEYLNLSKMTLSEALKTLGEAGNCKLVFNYDDLNRYEVSVTLENKTVEECLQILLKDKPFQYSFQDEFVVISYKEQAKEPVKYIVKGVIKDESGSPLPGVAVMIRGTNYGMATDVNGSFEFPVSSEKAVLEFSFVGMKKKTVEVNGPRTLEIVMVSEDETLEEVVVTGFQTISRERSSGAAVIVGQKDLQLVNTRNVSDNLEGLVPGMLSYGGQTSIRGISSFAVNSSPLVVIDGMPVENVTAGSSLLDGQVTSGLNNINPEDIETVTVLKDAASTSLYGVRASNGVIVITTKKAKDRKVNINASANYFFKPVSKLSYRHYASTGDVIDYELECMQEDATYQQNPLDYFESRNSMMRYTTALEDIYYSLAKNEISASEADTRVNKLRKNDYRKEYQDRMMRTAFTQDYNLSLSKGGENSNLFFSVRYEGNQYNRKDYSSDRLSMYVKNSLDLARWFKFTYGANVNYERSEYSSSGTWDAFYLSGTKAMPYETFFEEDGSYRYQYFINAMKEKEIGNTEGLNFMGYNALEDSEYSRTKGKNLYLRLFAQADFDLLRGLKLGIKFQYEDIINDMERYDEEESYAMRYGINRFATYNPSSTTGSYYNYNIPQGGRLEDAHRRYKNINFRTQLDYQRTIAERHDLTVLAGMEIRQNSALAKFNELFGYDSQKLTHQPMIDWEALGYGVNGAIYGSQAPQSYLPNQNIADVLHRYVSFYANAGYTYDNRYSLTGSVRIEQADLFGTDPKYRYRPLWSVGASWNLNNESFLQNTEWVNFLKLRLSYGITGNVDQTSSPYLIGTAGTSSLTGSGTVSINTPPNKLLRWEKTSSLNVGVDFRLLDRLNGSVDVYRRYSSDLLTEKQFDMSAGWESARVNNGEMSNKGIELSVNYTWLKRNGWTITTGLTAAYNKNKIEKVDYEPSDAEDVISDPYSYYFTGDAHGTMYGYRYQGLTDEGRPSILNEAGEVVSGVSMSDPSALVKLGQLTPKWNGAVNLNVAWKGLELYARFVYYTGHSLRKDVTPIYSRLSGGDVHRDIRKAWTPENTDTEVPAMAKNVVNSYWNMNWRYADIHERSASFIKMRNLGISYALPKQWLSKIHFNDVRIKAQVDNLWYWAANGEGIDPESFSANAGTRADKLMPTYSVGLSLGF